MPPRRFVEPASSLLPHRPNSKVDKSCKVPLSSLDNGSHCQQFVRVCPHVNSFCLLKGHRQGIVHRGRPKAQQYPYSQNNPNPTDRAHRTDKHVHYPPAFASYIAQPEERCCAPPPLRCSCPLPDRSLPIKADMNTI